MKPKPPPKVRVGNPIFPRDRRGVSQNDQAENIVVFFLRGTRNHRVNTAESWHCATGSSVQQTCIVLYNSTAPESGKINPKNHDICSSSALF